MPNHVTTTLRVEGPAADVAAFVAAHIVTFPATEEIVRGGRSITHPAYTTLDFNTIIPRPAILDQTVEGSGLSPEQARLNAQALAETGYASWYPWCLDKWGTKWNAYRFEALAAAGPGTYACRFRTAWSTPLPVFEALAARWPTLDFQTDSFDEGWGFACHGHGRAGVFTEEGVEPDNDSHYAAYGAYPESDEEPEPVDDDGPEDLVEANPGEGRDALGEL